MKLCAGTIHTLHRDADFEGVQLKFLYTCSSSVRKASARNLFLEIRDQKDGYFLVPFQNQHSIIKI